MSELSPKEIDGADMPDSTANGLPPPDLWLAVQTLMTYRGAVPPPNVVKVYEKYAPGATDRFMQIVEREQQRRIDRDSAELQLVKIQEENSKNNYRWGLIVSSALMGFYLTIMLVCVLMQAPVEFLVAMLGVPACSAIAAVISQMMLKRTVPKE